MTKEKAEQAQQIIQSIVRLEHDIAHLNEEIKSCRDHYGFVKLVEHLKDEMKYCLGADEKAKLEQDLRNLVIKIKRQRKSKLEAIIMEGKAKLEAL